MRTMSQPVNLVPMAFWVFFKMSGHSTEDPGKQQVTCLQDSWRL